MLSAMDGSVGESRGRGKRGERRKKRGVGEEKEIMAVSMEGRVKGPLSILIQE